MNPDVSVIVPVYNMEKYLFECLNSIVTQTLENIEIIVINDGSTDNSLAILREFEEKDTRIKIIDKKNEGVGRARNDGIRAAAGEFVAFMDSDDFYPEGKVLESLVRTAREENVKICGGKKVVLNVDNSLKKSEIVISEHGCRFGVKGLADYSDFQYDYGYTQYIYNREMLTENDIFFPPYRRFQDPPFFVKAMITAGKYYALDYETYCYRMVPAASKYKLDNTLDFLKGITDNLDISKKYNLPKLHYLSAMRLDKEGSFMAAQNLFDERRNELISAIIKTVNEVDTEWLRKNDFDIPSDFVPEVFDYAVSAAQKYEKLRKSSVGRLLSKLKK